MTPNEKPDLPFGRHLKSLRMEKGLSLEVVSRETRISMQILQAIEKEDHGRLPDPTFVKGFIKAYALMVGADSGKTVRNYLDSRLQYQKAVEAANRDIRQQSHFWTRLFLSFVIMAGVIGMSVYWLGNGKERPADRIIETVPEAAPQPRSTPDTATALHPPGVRPPKTQVQEPTPPKRTTWVLKVHALEHTWLKVIIDNQSPREYPLEADEQLELEAHKGYNLLIGDAAGLKLTLNGKPVRIDGKNGQVVALQLP